MRQRLALAAMLAGSLTFVVSLYFKWIHAFFCIPHGSCFASSNPDVVTDGWSGFGQIAAVLAIALAAGAVAAAVNRELATRLPLGRVTIALGIFALLSVSEIWTSAVSSTTGIGTTKIELGAGAYIGLAGVGIAGAGAVAARWGEITLPRRATAAVGTLITLALIASFVLPALNATAASAYEGDLSTYICVFACLGLLAWHGLRPGPRLATAAAIGTLVAGQLLPLRHTYAQWPYELWLLVGCAAGLLVLALAGGSGLRIRRPRVSELGIVVGSVLILVSMFLPWDSLVGEDPRFTAQGWSTAALAGVFALGLLLVLVWTGRLVRELAIGATLIVLAAGLATVTEHNLGILRHQASPSINLHYGAYVGFAGAALLLAFALGGLRRAQDKRFLFRLVPALAALALLSFDVTPNLVTLADVVYHRNLFALQSPFVTLSLLGAVAMLLTIGLLLRWVDGTGDVDVVRLPLALLALFVIVVLHDAIVTTTTTLGLGFGKGVSWEGWVAVFLCLLLVACGWVERKGAYRRARTDGSASTTSLATSP